MPLSFWVGNPILNVGAAAVSTGLTGVTVICGVAISDHEFSVVTEASAFGLTIRSVQVPSIDRPSSAASGAGRLVGQAERRGARGDRDRPVVVEDGVGEVGAGAAGVEDQRDVTRRAVRRDQVDLEVGVLGGGDVELDGEVGDLEAVVGVRRDDQRRVELGARPLGDLRA